MYNKMITFSQYTSRINESRTDNIFDAHALFKRKRTARILKDPAFSGADSIFSAEARQLEFSIASGLDLDAAQLKGEVPAVFGFEVPSEHFLCAEYKIDALIVSLGYLSDEFLRFCVTPIHVESDTTKYGASRLCKITYFAKADGDDVDWSDYGVYSILAANSESKDRESAPELKRYIERFMDNYILDKSMVRRQRENRDRYVSYDVNAPHVCFIKSFNSSLSPYAYKPEGMLNALENVKGGADDKQFDIGGNRSSDYACKQTAKGNSYYISYSFDDWTRFDKTVCDDLSVIIGLTDKDKCNTLDKFME